MEVLMTEQEKMANLEQSMKSERQEADRLAKEAMEAKKMAEAQAEKERLEREKMVAELNARLQKEAAERRQAELAQQELEQKMQALQEAQKEAQVALAQLQTARSEGSTGAPEEESLRQKVMEQEKMLASLEQENEILKQRQQSLTEQQIRTEEAIMQAGGRVDIPYPEIRSPNVKRRQAIYFKERVAGSTPGG
jgi:colicin import membrane protein